MYEFDWSREAMKEKPMILVMKSDPESHDTLSERLSWVGQGS